MDNLSLQNKLSALNLTEDGEDRMIIALDFGTTYSGIAYAFSSKPDEVHCVETWPGTPQRVPKTPTVLKYSNSKSFKWGYELDTTVQEKIVGIKLLLDPDQKRPLFDTAGASATKAELAKLGKPAVDVASDYIAAIYKHALDVIEGKMPKGYLDLLDKYFVLSVPAVWSDKAKDTTLRAARNAGIAPIELIKEPEAAALYTLHALRNQGLEVGDAITICDCGGGTVDLVSYELKNLHPLELAELVPSTGGIAGSMMINKRFENWVKDTVGERAYLDLRETDAYRRALKDFDENIKPGFRGDNDELQFVNFPMANLSDNEAKGVKSNSIKLQGRDLQDIFEPVFDEIEKLVKEQVNEVRIKRLGNQHPKGANIKAIFLVGGFGESQYLKKALTAAHPEIQVIQPNGAWAAIVKGAALSKLPQQAKVLSSIAERHYGVIARSIYEERVDKDHEKSWDEFEKSWKCNRMTWFISKHDDLERDRVISFSFYRNFDFNYDQTDTFTETLRMCASDFAPVHPNKSVQENCVLTVDASDVPHSQFKEVHEGGNKFLRLSFKLLVRIEGARMAFSFECGGREYASVEADY